MQTRKDCNLLYEDYKDCLASYEIARCDFPLEEEEGFSTKRLNL